MADANTLQARLVDTNVLIVASAADAGSPFGAEATPIEEAALRQQVFDWLEAFVADPARHAVLDVDWHVCGEYRHKLTEQDYGWLAMMHKMDRGEVVWVDVLLNKDGNAVLVPLDVDEFGAVRNWPQHFFGDAMGEAREQARARAQRLREVSGG